LTRAKVQDEIELHLATAMVKKASNKRLVAQAPSPAPKAIPFPRLSEKSHIRCHTFLEDQILLLSVRLYYHVTRLFANTSRRMC
jgi:hypothetical protein